MPAHTALTLSDGTANHVFSPMGIYSIAGGTEARWRDSDHNSGLRLGNWSFAARLTLAEKAQKVDRILLATDVPVCATVDGTSKVLFNFRWVTYGYCPLDGSETSALVSYNIHRNALGNAGVLDMATKRIPITSA